MDQISFASSVCRLCAREDDEQNLIQLTEEEIRNIKKCLQIEIKSDEPHAKAICYLCKINVSFVYKFFEFCNENDVRLMSFSKDAKSDSSDFYNDEIDVDLRHNVKEEEPCSTINMLDKSDFTNEFDTVHDDANDSNNLISIIEQQIEKNSFIESYEMELGEIQDIEDQFELDDEEENDKHNDVNEDGILKIDDIHNQRMPRRKQGLHVCEACDEICPSFRAFYEHLKIHGNKRYQCRQCFRWFKQRCNLREHLMIHTGNIPTCKDCGNQYEIRGNLSRHIRAVHENRSRYECQKCGSVFTQSHALKTHLVVHARERTFECDVCAKRFKSQMYLNLHRSRVHDTMEVIKDNMDLERRCNFCERISDNIVEHKKHLLEHASERPFACNICGKRFRLENIYKTHLLVHTDQTPYKCNYCERTFTELVLLNGHESTHIGKKKLFCDMCGKVFLTIGHYNVHVRRHAGVMPYACDICNEKCFSRSLLRTHKHTKHKSERKTKSASGSGPVKLNYKIINQLEKFEVDNDDEA